MGITKKATYKVHNGTDFDTIHFETEASQVKTASGSDVETQLADKVSKTWGTVFSATLQNGWTGILRYKKNDFGQVYLYTYYPGLTVGTKTAGTIIAKLPADFCPVDRVPIICGYNINDASIGLFLDSGGDVRVTTDGAAKLTGDLRFSALYQANS